MDAFKHIDLLKKFLSDERGRKILSHPKLLALLKDEEFSRAVKEQNILKLASHPGFLDRDRPRNPPSSQNENEGVGPGSGKMREGIGTDHLFQRKRSGADRSEDGE